MSAEWQPIETAPKDGTPVLLYGPHAAGTYREVSPFYRGHWTITWMDGYGEPTHWMPLPEPPATGNPVAQGDGRVTRMIRDEIEAILERVDLTQKDAAAKIGVSQSYLSDVMNGRRDLTPALANRLAELGPHEIARDGYRRVLHRLGADQAGWQWQ